MNRKVEYGLLMKDFALSRFAKGEALERRRKRIVDRMGLMGGLPQKIGQVLSFREFEDGRQLAFSRLTEGDDRMGIDEVREILVERLGAAAASRFSWISPEGISASLGQTHKARLDDGGQVGVKVQYPGIGDALRKDLDSFGWLVSRVGRLGHEYDVDPLKREMGEMIAKELDYGNELRWLNRFSGYMERFPILEVPCGIEVLSGDGVLCMTWVEGERYDRLGDWSRNAKVEACEALLRFFLYSTFCFHCVHADPHPGNVRFYRSGWKGKVGLVDFGSVRELESGFISGFGRLVEGSMNGDLADLPLMEIYEELGFQRSMLERLESKLLPVSQILLAPFSISGNFDINQWQLGVRLKETLGEQRMTFRCAAPPELIFWIRAFHGVVHYMNAFDANLDWASLAREALAEGKAFVDEKGLPIPVANGKGAERSGPEGNEGSFLRIEVTRKGETVASLELPGRSVMNLEDLVPEEAKAILEGKGCSLTDLRENVVKSGFQSQELFGYESDDKRVRIWVERP